MASYGEVPSYLVFFSRDPVDDELARAIVGRVRATVRARTWTDATPGWFDEPDAETPEERTCGAYLRTDDLATDDAAAVLRAARTLSAELELAVEVQYNERPLGYFAPGGVADGAALCTLMR